MKATNIILQGLPADIYSLVNHHRVSKDLWERVQLLMQGFFVFSRCLTLRDDPIACLNKAMAFLTYVASSKFPTANNQLRTSSIQETKLLFKMAWLQCNKFRGDKGKIILVLPIRAMLLVQGEILQVGRQELLNATTAKVKSATRKDTTICKLKDTIKSLRENTKDENVAHDKYEFEPINKELENSVAKLLYENERLCNEINHVKQIFKDQFDSIKQTCVRHKEQSDSLINKLNLKSVENEDLKDQIQDKVFVITSLKNDLRKLKEKEIVENVVHTPSTTTIAPGMFKLDLEPLPPRFTSANVVQIVLWHLDTPYVPKHMYGKSLLAHELWSRKILGTVRYSRNDHIARIMRYGDYKLGNVIISRVYYVEGLRHNLFSVGQFCDADLEVAFQKNTYFIRNLEGVDLLSGSRDTNLYTISLDDMLKSSLICPLSKASKTKSWLWQRRLSHLNFGTLNKLAKDGLARGIPRLKF
ncbi:retrovirus-related pol polyprotein from transposon TNT 1-94 [Tanacetum coccineum]